MEKYVYDLINNRYIFGCECSDNTCCYCHAISNPGCSDYEIVDKRDYDRLQEYKISKWAKWENKRI